MLLVIGIIALLLAFSFLLLGGQTSKSTPSNADSIGMYNMDLHIKYKRLYSETGDTYYLYASIFNEVLGYAAQGRTSDINYVYKNDLYTLGYHEDFVQLMVEIKSDLIAMARISDRVSKSDMPLNSTFTSVGEFEDYKLRKSKAFMERFNKLNGIDLKSLYDKQFSDT